MNRNASFSLLFADPNREQTPRYGEETLAFLGPIPGDERTLSTVKPVLMQKTTRKDIEFRREIIEDFLRTPSLLTLCEELCRKWEQLEETAKREAPIPPEATYGQALEQLKQTSVSLMEHLRFLRRSAEEMEAQHLESQGLFAFSEFLRNRADSAAVQELTETVSAYPLLRPETTKVVLRLIPDSTGKFRDAYVEYLGADEGKYWKKNPPRREDFTADLPKQGDFAEREDPGVWVVQALKNLNEAFRDLTKGIRDRMAPLKEGLLFYQYALSLTERAKGNGQDWTFPLPDTQPGPKGLFRDLREISDGTARPGMEFAPSSAFSVFSGEWGTSVLKMVAQAQIFSAAGLPVFGNNITFCPEQRVLVYDSTGKTVDEEIAAIEQVYRDTKRGDLVLLNHPLISVGNAPAEEILRNLIRAFLKKGATLRLASDIAKEAP